MARFAREIFVKANKVVNDLEVTLGPGTGELSMRFGLHSGAVTAGVVRGENARFQLFGDVSFSSCCVKLFSCMPSTNNNYRL